MTGKKQAKSVKNPTDLTETGAKEAGTTEAGATETGTAKADAAVKAEGAPASERN